MPQPITRKEWLELAAEVGKRPWLGLFLVHKAVENTVKAGWDAPRRWSGFLRGYPYWRYLKRQR